ncbi:MAG TPA: M15 family metallopeptidase [Pseudolabrys sp.]
MDHVSEARLSLIYPALASKVRTMHDILELEGIEIRVVQGLRSWNEQDNLYAQGRTAPGKIVTNVKGGHSYHNFGLAVDCVPSTHTPDQPFDPDWNASHPAWKRMSDVGISLGLVSGATWRTFPDAPHFQLSGRFKMGSPDDEVRQLFADGGMAAVWEEVTKSS